MGHIRGEITWIENLSSMAFRIYYTDFPLTKCLETSLRDLGKPKDQAVREEVPGKGGAWALPSTDFPLCSLPTGPAGVTETRLLITRRLVGQDSGRCGNSPHCCCISALKRPLTPKDVYRGKNNMMIWISMNMSLELGTVLFLSPISQNFGIRLFTVKRLVFLLHTIFLVTVTLKGKK